MKNDICVHLKFVAKQIKEMVLVEDKSINHLITYSSKSRKSYYVEFEKYNKAFVVRISNHNTRNNKDFNFNIIIQKREPFKFSSTVMNIIKKINKL